LGFAVWFCGWVLRACAERSKVLSKVSKVQLSRYASGGPCARGGGGKGSLARSLTRARARSFFNGCSMHTDVCLFQCVCFIAHIHRDT
jgi:hypothetical protein